MKLYTIWKSESFILYQSMRVFMMIWCINLELLSVIIAIMMNHHVLTFIGIIRLFILWCFLGVLHIISPQWSLFWYTELIDVAISLHDFKLHLPNTGFSLFNRLSSSLLKIIFILTFVIFKGVYLRQFFMFKKGIEWAIRTSSMTYRTCECVGILDTRFFRKLFRCL